MSRLLSLATLLAMTAAAFAGCLDADLPDPGANLGEDILPDKGPIYEKIRALLANVPCEAPFSASKTTDNMRRIAHTNFAMEAATENLTEPVGSRELDHRGDYMLTTLAGRGSIGILNVRDPLNPTPLSIVGVKGEYDVKFVTNDTAVVGVGAGIAIVDVRNPAEIVQTGLWKWEEAPMPPRDNPTPTQNAHMLAAARIADRDWVFLAPNSNTGIWIFEMTGEPGAKKLTYVTQTLPLQGGVLGPHDMTVQWDADLNTWVLYSADGFHGWTAFDIADPTQPELIGGLIRPEAGYTHTIQAAKVGDRRLVATIQEVGVNQLEIYDATNLRTPVLIGRWQHSAAAVNPQHNLNIVEGRLYVAHYGNGVYVFDLSKIDFDATQVKPDGATGLLAGTFKPVAHYGGSSFQNPTGFTQFYDVVVREGVLYAASYSEPSLGIHVIGDGCLTPGDATQTSFG